MAAPLNAIDAISGAFSRAGDLLFHPYRWSFWWRMAFIAVLTGEAGGGGNVFRIPAEILDKSGRNGGRFLAAAPPWAGISIAAIAVLILAGLVFTLVFMYLACVFRFVLFDVVLTGRYRLREGFARWQHHGTRFFWWVLGYVAIMMFAVGFCVLLIVGSVSGIKSGSPISILVLMFAALLALCFFVAGALVFVLTKDFVIPIMAMDGVSALDAWARLRPMITANLVDYLAYIGMKIVLAIAAAVAVGVASLIILLVLALPVGIIIGVLAAALHLTWNWNPLTIFLAILAGLVFFLLIFFLMGLLGVPVAVFFQSYALLFFGRRYRPLELALYPEPPAPPPAPVAPPINPPPAEPGPAPA